MHCVIKATNTFLKVSEETAAFMQRCGVECACVHKWLMDRWSRESMRPCAFDPTYTAYRITILDPWHLRRSYKNLIVCFSDPVGHISSKVRKSCGYVR